MAALVYLINEDWQPALLALLAAWGLAGLALWLRGLRRGDVIVEVTQQDVKTVEDVKARIEDQRAAGRSVVLLSIYRRGQYAHVPVKLDEDE